MYLNRINSSPNEYDPYSLEVMPFAAIKQDDFYTMSVRGITHYQDGISVDFASECASGSVCKWSAAAEALL